MKKLGVDLESKSFDLHQLSNHHFLTLLSMEHLHAPDTFTAIKWWAVLGLQSFKLSLSWN